jgi:glucokinase
VTANWRLGARCATPATILELTMQPRCAIGVDIGGTKCAAGLVVVPEGRIVTRRLQATEPQRGGEPVLADVIELIDSLQADATRLSLKPVAVGVGIAELVSSSGEILSDATIHWKDLPVRDEIQARVKLPVRLEADVRAAARAEAHAGAGRGLDSFLYVTVGTGISASLVLRGEPYCGARGLTGTFFSSRSLIPTDEGSLVGGPPLEQFAAGPALATRFAAAGGDASATAQDVIELSEAGDSRARGIVTSAAEALGVAIAQLVNLLDPEAVVIGGGLGLVGGRWQDSIESAMRAHIWSGYHRDVPLYAAGLGVDAGVVGAALAAVAAGE